MTWDTLVHYSRSVVGATGLAALLAGCAAADTTPASAPEAAGEPFLVRHSMQQVVNPAIMAIWDIGNAAMDETGSLDPAQMEAAHWAALADAAAQLEVEGRRMAAAETIRAAAPYNMATEEFEVSMADVQRFIDADPQGFRALGAQFADYSARLRAAALTEDVAVASELVAGVDTACAECHARYWYAEQ